MKKIIFISLFCFSLSWMTASAQSQTQNTCYAYGHHKVACPGSTADQRTVVTKEKSENRKESIKSDKQDGSTGSPQASNKKKYNAEEFKTKHYFFKSASK